MKNYDVLLQDWAGNELFIGSVSDPMLEDIVSDNDPEEISLSWIDESNKENPYECLGIPLKELLK